MNANERFEYMAAKFYEDTRMMAPGKGDGMISQTYAERKSAWNEWTEKFYSEMFDAKYQDSVWITRDEITDKTEEIKALQAQVEGYKEIVGELIGGAEDIEPFDIVISRSDYDMLIDHQLKTPQQCLADVRAEAIEAATKWLDPETPVGEETCDLLCQHAQELRDNAK